MLSAPLRSEKRPRSFEHLAAHRSTAAGAQHGAAPPRARNTDSVTMTSLVAIRPFCTSTNANTRPSTGRRCAMAAKHDRRRAGTIPDSFESNPTTGLMQFSAENWSSAGPSLQVRAIQMQV